METFKICQLNSSANPILPNILQLYEQTFNSTIKIPQYELINYIDNGIYTTNYILDNHNNLCGYCFHMNIPSINAVQIEYIAIDPNYRNKGLCKMLFNYVYDFYCNHKILTLECEKHLIEFYGKLGCILIPLPYKVKCDTEMHIMFKSHLSNIPNYEIIVREIEKENGDGLVSYTGN